MEFNRNEYISRGRRFELAENLHLSETQIKIWVSSGDSFQSGLKSMKAFENSFRIEGQKTKELKRRRLISSIGKKASSCCHDFR